MNYSDPMLPFGTDKCLCRGCGEYFNSTAAFDKHRLSGKCLTPQEMLDKGMGQKDSGHWVTKLWDRESHWTEAET